MEAELQQILLQVSELQSRREVCPGVLRCPPPPPPQRQGAPPLCSIPSRLLVSPGLGGTPLTPQLTESLRAVLFGGTFHVFSYGWRSSAFRFREPDSEWAYALEVEQGGARPVLMAVQARIIKHLLFSADRRTLHSLREAGRPDQEAALAAALTDSLWLAGQEVSATVTLATEEYCITPHLDYKLDNFTEKLQLFTFSTKEAVRSFILKHISCFTEGGGHGVILFLYSLVCSRTADRLKEDLDSTPSLLRCSLEDFSCRQALVNLLLTGRASPHVFDGTASCGGGGVLQGVLSRCDVGYLHWSREQMEGGRLPQVGSRLRTPLFPVWLCSIDSSHSVLFSVRRSLLSDWRTERLFQLHHYSGRRSQGATATLTVDTHSHHRGAPPTGDPDRRSSSLEMTIRTKWEGAAIE